MRTRHSLRSLAFIVLLPAGVFAQGTLTPTGSPAPSMKTLDQLNAQLLATDAKTEARTPVDLLGGDATGRFVIGQPGSYYLRGPIIVAAAGQSAIRVSAPHVTIDLNGFLVGGPGAAVSTVAGITSTGSGTVVRNGKLSGWAIGVSLGANSGAADLVVLDCGNIGVSLPAPNSLARNLVVNAAGNVGIAAGVVEHCTVSNILGGTAANFGIDATLVRGCHVSTVTATGGGNPAYGIRAQLAHECRVDGVSSAQGSYGITSTDNDTGAVAHSVVAGVNGVTSAYGIRAGSVTDCEVQDLATETSTVYGISGTRVRDCRVRNISSAGAGVGGTNGISGELVQDCHVSAISVQTDNGFGIFGLRVSGCVVDSVHAAQAAGEGTGISLSGSGSAVGNTVTDVRNFGIRATSYCLVQNNTIGEVGIPAAVTDGALIRASGNDARIEGNTVTGFAGADYGIRVTGSRNLVTGNRVSGIFAGAATGAGGVDTPEFNIGVGNRFGPIVSTFAATGEITSTNPHANFRD